MFLLNSNFRVTSSLKHIVKVVNCQTERILNKACVYPVLNIEQHRTYAKRKTVADFGIHWERPDKVPVFHPSKSGDLEGFNAPEKSRPILELELKPLQEKLKSCDEITRKLLSLEFHKKEESVKVAHSDVIKRVQRHQYDFDSLEVRIAKLTIKIRNLQLVESLLNKKVGKLRDNLNISVKYRNKLLEELRGQCYRKYEWMLDELNIRTRLHSTSRLMVRKEGIKKLVAMRNEAIKEERLNVYKTELNALKEPFLEEKADATKWILETEKKYGLPPSVDAVGAQIELDEYRKANNSDS